jgi:hypothetical protein
MKIKKKDCSYEGHLEMIGTHPICNNFIIFRLNIKQLLAQHILLLGHMSLPSPWELPDGFKEPFFRRVAIPLMDSRLCNFLATTEAPYPDEHITACRCFLSMKFR